MKMKNRKLVFGGQGGGHGRSSTSLDRWGDFYNLWDLVAIELAFLVIFLSWRIELIKIVRYQKINFGIICNEKLKSVVDCLIDACKKLTNEA